LLLFVALIARGFLIALHATRNRFASLLVIGIMLHVGLQAVLNVGVATAVIPNTGVLLPFFSYGGTGLVILLAEMGIVLGVSRIAPRVRVKETWRNERRKDNLSHRGRRHGGAY
jgi:cell division protein FtsW